MDAAVVVDDVALGFEEWCLRGCVRAVEPAARWHDTPPRQPWRPPQHVRHRLTAPWSADLLGEPAVRDEVTRHQPAHSTDHLPLERRRLVILRPRRRSRRQGRARVGMLDHLSALPRRSAAHMMPATRASWRWCAFSLACRPRSRRLAPSRSDHPIASGTRAQEPAFRCAVPRPLCESPRGWNWRDSRSVSKDGRRLNERASFR